MVDLPSLFIKKFAESLQLKIAKDTTKIKTSCKKKKKNCIIANINNYSVN